MKMSSYENSSVTVQWPHENHIPALRCPITGMVISLGFGPDQDPERDSPLQPADEKCPTLLFRYNYETGMEYVQEALSRTIADKKRELVESGEFEDEDDVGDIEVISEHIEDLGEAPLIIDVPTWGLPGDGIVVGLDLALPISSISEGS